jgi:uncharacterized membrane protein
MQYLPKRSFNPDDYTANRVPGAIGYLLFFVPLAACPGSVYGRFCANQGLLFLVAEVLLGFSRWLFSIIPLIHYLTDPLFGLVQVVVLGIQIFLMILALNDDVRELPFIGNIQFLR